ncbi:SRPBCC domain-containing protein [Pedobacter metabolipauper]|uniref:Uncharacterized protein YndB with AHSA1/START domain n=1 Tax=Pedobacter metabolipauper TaxID=425513 RepID=A0A4R6T0G0_9SPHI|nr:SRPBCC domain-containing protein [Pedobacter metabolipauper]TDQ11867.1 uncharacterized protein YndB with AHSA1/START domain [Pedobacter metabolipauper]
MENQKLEITAKIQISKMASEVFEAIADPQKMSNYFILEGDKRLEENQEVTWKWPEFEGEFKIRTGKIVKDELVSFYWEASGKDNLVEIKLDSADHGKATIVTVTEKDADNDEKGIKWLKGNTEGWANFLACMKAYLEYGINLRKGAFDFMKK